MRFHAESRRDRYDAVVVGSGIGGLTAAALLARAGRDVLVVERHDRVGGYAHAFRRGPYLFDSAVHMIGGCAPTPFAGGGLVYQMLCAVGAQEHCEFERIDPCYQVQLPGGVFRAPGDFEEFVRAHVEAFPSDAKGIRQVLHEALAIRDEIRRAADLEAPFEVMRRPARFPALLRYRRATLGQVLEAHVDSAPARAVLGALWPYVGLPPSRVSFLYFSTMLMSYVAEGTYYCRGSFQRFADALAGVVRRQGGEVLLRSPVRRIRVEGDRAVGVVLENGQHIDAPLVLSNADATQTAEELVGEASLRPRELRRLRRLEPSVSGFVVYAAAELSLPPGSVHETFLYPGLDHDAHFASGANGLPSWLTVTVPTLSDPALAPPGEQLLVLTTLLPHDAVRDWRREKERVSEHLLELAEGHLPGLGSGLRLAESGTPRTLERYTRNTRGALYGWAATPRQVGPARLGTRTSIAGLYRVGHWTQPGGGIYGVVSSGVQVARSALGCRSERDLWRRLGH